MGSFPLTLYCSVRARDNRRCNRSGACADRRVAAGSHQCAGATPSGSDVFPDVRTSNENERQRGCGRQSGQCVEEDEDEEASAFVAAAARQVRVI